MTVAAQIWAFVVHLRVHYQLLVLSGGYLLGGLFVTELSLQPFLLHFFTVHILLNGGLTAYNSYWDDDEGPIGGIEHPPKMQPWMHPAAIGVQLLGLPLIWSEGLQFVALWLLTMALSVAYSRKGPRWKAHPWLSLVSVGVGTGMNTFLMGYLAAGEAPVSGPIIGAALGVAVLLLSLYPVSQVFQMQEDRDRGDITFAARYGLAGVRRFFLICYPVGLLTASGSLYVVHPDAGVAFGLGGAGGGLVNGIQLWRLEGVASEYRAVMRLKYGAALCFVGFITLGLIWVHAVR